MGILDATYALKFVKTLTTPWEDTAAYKEGVIDAKGKVIQKPKTSRQRKAYTIFDRLIYNIRRITQKITKYGGSSGLLTKYATALFLLKEHQSSWDVVTLLSENENHEKIINQLSVLSEHNHQYPPILENGIYRINQDLPIYPTLELLAFENDQVEIVKEHQLFNCSIYEGRHLKTAQKIYITADQIQESAC